MPTELTACAQPACKIPQYKAARFTAGSADRSATNRQANTLANHKELSDFFVATERRAYKQALFAVRDEQVALELVQEAMTRLVEKYPARPSAELPPLFQRILQNTIRDYFRRQKVRALWTTQISSLASDPDTEHDPLETLEPGADAEREKTPFDHLQQSQILEIIEQALQQLPLRQRQAFVLRYWEEMDVAETAVAMGCSQGSVKTHCSRAVRALAAILKEKGVTL